MSTSVSGPPPGGQDQPSERGPWHVPVAAPARRLRLAPTAAHTRALLTAVAFGILAVVLARPELLVPALPMLSWVVLAHVRRLWRGEGDEDEADAGGTDAGGAVAGRTEAGGAEAGGIVAGGSGPGPGGPELRASTSRVLEGGTVRLHVRGIRGTLVCATFPMRSHADFAPRFGSAVGDGAVDLRVSARRWGNYDLGPAHVQVADAFGAFRAQQWTPALPLQVTPTSSILDAPLEVPSVIGLSGAHLSRRRGSGTALADVRPFRPGDRLHRINWRVTSRTGQMHTNETFTEQDTDVLLVTDTLLDLVPPEWADAEAPSSLDITVRASAAIARHYLAAGDRVALHDLGHLIGRVRPGTGPRQLRVLTEALSRARRDAGDARSARRLRRVRSGTLTVVMSPLLAPQVIEQIGDLVAQGADVIVVDTLPPSIGDASRLQGRPTRSASGRRSDRFWAEAWVLRRLLRERTVRELRERGVPVTGWEGPASLAPVLLSLAAAGSAPRMRRS